MSRFLKCLFAAGCLFAGVIAQAEQDENGVEPKHWYKFNGNLDSSGATALSIEGEKGASYVASFNGGQAYLFKSGYHPYGSGISRGNGDFTVVTIAKTCNRDHGMVWTQGGKNTERGFGLVSVGATQVALRVFGANWSSAGTDLITANVPDATTAYHVYTLIYTNGSRTFTLYVDDAAEPAGSGQVADSATESAFPDNHFQWGSLFQGLNYGMTQGFDACLDDFRLYQQALTVEQIGRIFQGTVGRAVWGNIGSASEKGVATSVNGGAYTTFTVNFGANDNISQTGIDDASHVRIRKVRLFRRSKYTDNPPATITISQDGVPDVVSSSVSLVSNQKVYGASWPGSTKDYYTADAFDAVFDSTTMFDSSKPITVTFPSVQLFMIQPANSVMTSGNNWSPAIEITGACEAVEPRNFTATLSGTKKWSELEWTPALTTTIRSTDTLTINVSGTSPTLLMDKEFQTVAPLTFSGGQVTVGADTSLYENGCWQKTILSASSIAATGGISFPALAAGFYGAYSKTDTAIVLRAQNKEVISINIAGGNGGGTGADSPAANIVSGTDFYGLAPTIGSSWNNINRQWQDGGNQTITIESPIAYDGQTTIARPTMNLQATGKNTWQAGSLTNPFLRGYLDDGGGVSVMVHGVPYTKYDVIVYATSDSAGIRLNPVTVNGVEYTFSNGATVPGSTAWGEALCNTPEFGKNALRISGLSGGELTIASKRVVGRGTLCAVQVINQGNVEVREHFSATISESTKFSAIAWDKEFHEGQLNEAVVNVDNSATDEVTLTFDNPGVTLGKLIVNSARDIRLTASQNLANIGQVVVTGCTGMVTYAYPVAALETSSRKIAYAGGTSTLVGILHGAAGTWLDLVGGTYALSETHGDNQTTVNVTDSILNYNDAIALGKTSYVVGGNSEVNAVKFVLVQGKGNNCSFVLKDSASVAVSGTTMADSNQNSVMFGHWEGNSTFTIQDAAAFTAKGTQILVGKTGGNQTINVKGGAITAKGIKAAGYASGVNTLNISGGSLVLGEVGISSYANSRTISIKVTGDATISSSAAMPISQPMAVKAGATLTLDASAGAITFSGNVENKGTILVSGGVVRLSPDVTWSGSGLIVVLDGATLDLNGRDMPNSIRVSGAGARGAGALVSAGGRALSISGLVLDGDATIGGTDAITIAKGASVDLGGYVLKLSGNGLNVKLADLTVGGAGRIVVSGATLSSSGTTSLEANDLQITADGILDLSDGMRLSCRGFKSTGRIVGEDAMLAVSGTFDASSRIMLPKLSLLGGATLKGTGLAVSTEFLLGDRLFVVADESAAATKLATVPNDKTTYATAVVLNGQDGYEIRHVGTRLLVVRHDVVTANVAVDAVAGTNFESLKVSGTIDGWGGEGTGHGSTNVYVTLVSESTGATVIREARYVPGASGASGTFEVDISGVDAGDTYTVSAHVEIGAGETKTDVQSRHADAVVARSVVRNPDGSGGWIYEDADTFAGVSPGTGNWYGTNGVACADNGVISFFAEDWARMVEFQPFTMSLEMTYSFVKDLYFHVSFDCPGFYSYEPRPNVPDGASAAFTLMADEDDNCCLAVASNGMWEVISRDIFAPDLSTRYEMLVRLDGVASNIQYNVIVDGDVVRLATCPVVDSKDVSLDLAGAGSVKLIEGIGQDAHLAQVGDEEFWTIGDAINAAGADEAIVPLWWSRYVVSGDRGLFRIIDPNGYLQLIWQKWHHWGLEDGAYRYISGNNWIEYADASGVVESNDGSWLVTNEVGLAWIAERSTNQWFCGTVSVSEDLDLSSKNWTPVAQFRGTFDGKGHTIRGLNNTNVIIDALLGEAGYYFGGPTNDWGYMAYGLFGSATNASFANVTFEDVSISNVSDSTAVLLGVHAGGDLAVANVEVVSGCVFGEGRAVAGLLTVGGDTMGDIVVTGNVNRATIAGTIANDGDGGNVAQILAGTSWDTLFLGEVVATNNVGVGEFDVAWVNHDGYHFALPICNFAAAVTRITADGSYRRFVEANEPTSIPIDPFHRTARMLAGTFANGADNIAGWWMDTITATPAGGHVDIVGTGNVIDLWESVLIDRDLSFNLNSNFVYTVYDNDTFTVPNGVVATVSNGVVYVGENYVAFGGDVTGLTTNNVKVVKLDEDFYERTVMVVDGMFLSVSEAIGYLHAGSCIELFEGTGLTIDAASNSVLLDGNKIAELSEYQSLTNAVGGDGTVAYMVRLNEKAVPDYDFELTGVSAGSSAVQINVVGARAGLYYAVQHKTSLVENWSEPEKNDWVYVRSDGSVIQFTLPADKASGFYRVKVTDYLPEDE